MKALRSLGWALCALLVADFADCAISSPDLSGRWELTTTYPGGFYVAGLDLKLSEGRYAGRSGWLVPDWAPFYYSGQQQSAGLHLKVTYKSGDDIGELTLKFERGEVRGSGKIHGVEVKVEGRRPIRRPPQATVHNFEPRVYYRLFSGSNPPALHIFPGDTVRTSTVDSSGIDQQKQPRSLPQNPLTGPFYIEGTMPGDTIAVHFVRIRLNRDTASQAREALYPGILPPGYKQEPANDWSSQWNLDRAQGTATPDRPSPKLKDFKVKLVPMLGCVGVAPYWNYAIGAAELGPYGGNLDYNQIVEGTTVYLPVYQAGALLAIGDGHALQEDGEITGNGLETSMDVEFSVDLLPNQMLDQPWEENDEFIMVSGVGGALPEAFQRATAGLSKWLKGYYRLNSAEVATVLASSIHYDVATIVDPEVHVVAKLRKDALRQIPKPDMPSDMFCQPSWGCDVE